MKKKIDHLIVFVITSVPHTLYDYKKCGQSRLFFHLSYSFIYSRKKEGKKQIDTNIGRCFSYQFTFC